MCTTFHTHHMKNARCNVINERCGEIYSGLLSFRFLLSSGLLRVLAGSVDESGKLCAGSFQEGAQMALLLCIALARAGCLMVLACVGTISALRP